MRLEGKYLWSGERSWWQIR